MIDFTAVYGRLNDLLYRRTIRRLTVAEIELARDWSLRVIRREHPDFSEAEVEDYYEKLLQVRVIATDEWARRYR